MVRVRCGWRCTNPPYWSPAYWAGIVEAGCQRGPLSGTVGLTGAYQAVFITIPATAMNTCPEFAYTVIHAPGPGWP